MSRLEAALRTAILELDAAGASYALIGGLAVSARTEPRFTRDIDLVVAVEGDRAAEQLVRRLTGRGYRVFAVVEHEDAERLATVRLGDPAEGGGGVVVDMLFASSGIEPEIVRDAELLEIFPGLAVPVAETGHLIALKVLARDDERRPQDRVDLLALRRVADDQARQCALDAARLIEARGFARDRSVLLGVEALFGPAPNDVE